MSLDLGKLVDVMILTNSDENIIYLPSDSEGEYLPVYSWINSQETRGYGFAGMSPLPKGYSFSSYKMPKELVLGIIESYLKKKNQAVLLRLVFMENIWITNLK